MKARDGETYLLEAIDHDRAEIVYNSLNDSSEEFQELFNRYHRFAEINVSTGALVQKSEANYLADVEKDYSAAVKLYAAYKKAYKLSAKKAKIKLLETNISNLEEAMRAEIEAKKEVVESWDENIKKTA